MCDRNQLKVWQCPAPGGDDVELETLKELIDSVQTMHQIFQAHIWRLVITRHCGPEKEVNIIIMFHRSWRILEVISGDIALLVWHHTFITTDSSRATRDLGVLNSSIQRSSGHNKPWILLLYDLQFCTLGINLYYQLIFIFKRDSHCGQ